MTNQEHNSLRFSICFSKHQAKFGARMIFQNKPAEAPGDSGPKPVEKPPIIDLDTMNNQTEFLATDQKQTLEKLALGDKVLAENFKQAISESLNRQGYDGNIDDLWKEMDQKYKAKAMKVANGRIMFLDGTGADAKEVAPNFSVIPIKIDITQFRAQAPRSKYYNPDNGVVDLQNWSEVKKVTVADIIKNARAGTQISVAPSTDKPARNAVFEDGKTARYTDGKKEVVKIYDNYVVKLLNEGKGPAAEENVDLMKKFPSAGEYKFVKKTEKTEGYSADDYINSALDLPGKKPNLVDENNANILRLRQMLKDGYTPEKYVNFLKSNDAIKSDRINLIVDTTFLSEKELAERAAKDKDKLATDAKERSEKDKAERNRFYLPKNLIDNPPFLIKDAKLVELVANDAKWNAAWDNDSISGLKALKGIIMSEPDTFGPFAKDPDKLRDRIRDAITNGKNDRIYFSDLIDDILKVRMPSYAEKADKKAIEEASPKGEHFGHYFDSLPANQKNLNQIKKANAFLKKLGNETFESAMVTKSEPGAIWMNLSFEGNGYTVRVDEGGHLSGSTIQIFYLNSKKPYANGGGYDNDGGYTVSGISEGNYKEGNDVQTWFRDSVTPAMTYSRLTEMYNICFDAKGNPKPNINKAFADKIRNVVIGGNRFLLQLQNLAYTEKTTGKLGEYNIVENRGVEIKDGKYVDTIADDAKWKAEWANPKFQITKNLKASFAEDPVLREIPVGQQAQRIQDAVTNWSNSSLDFGDIVEYVLKGIKLPSGKPLEGLSNFREEYAAVIDAKGNIKPGVFDGEAKAVRLKAISKAANRLLIAFEGKTESANETSETTYASQFLRNAKNLSTQEYNIDKVFSADDVLNNYKSDQIKNIAIFDTLKTGVGLQMNDDVLGETMADKVTKHKPELFQAILKIYTLPELVNGGFVKKGVNSKLPNLEFYVIDHLPQPLIEKLNSRPNGPTGLTYFELTYIDNPNLKINIGNEKENLNPSAKYRRYAESLFPIKESDRTYSDVSGAVAKDREHERIYNRLDYTFAHTQFLKTITKGDSIDNNDVNAEIDQDRMIFVLKGYADLFDARLDLQYGPEEAPKVRKELLAPFGGKMPVLDAATLDQIMADPKKAEAFSKIVREGFVYAHDKKVEGQRKQAIENLNVAFKNWENMLTPEEKETLIKCLRDAKVPEEQIPIAVQNILPVWFGVGVDANTGLGIGVGIGYPIKLGKNAEYGTIMVGGGVGLGAGPNGLGVGLGAGVGYKTPHFGPFALFAGGGLGVGLDSNGNVGVGAGFGGGVEIELGTVGSTKISLDVGVAAVGPFIVPGAVLNFEKDHEVSLANLTAEAHKKFGLDKVDAKLDATTDPVKQKAAIAENTFFRKAYDRSYDPKFDQASPEEVVKNFRKYEAALDEAVRQNYDPALFGPVSAVAIGFGWDPLLNKFIVGVGVGLVVGEVIKTTAFQGKGADVMDQEIQAAHLKDLSMRYGKDQLNDKERSEVSTLISSGKLLVIPGSKDLAIFMPKGAASVEAPAKTGPEAPEAVGSLEKKFNEKLKPLNLRVEYDAGKKLFELKFNNWNQFTNYDIAVDSQMKNGGIVMDKGHIYLASDMAKSGNLNILRADYEYPFKKDNKNYHSIVTISDSPLTPANVIYSGSKQLISSKGGDWFPQEGLGKNASNIYKIDEAAPYLVDSAKMESASGAPKPDSDETKGNIAKLSISEDLKGAADEKACTEFAKTFLKAHPVDYRFKSNKETETNKFDDLNKLLVNDWKKSHGGVEPNATELNLIRLKIMDQSFLELDGVKPADRQKAFRDRLDRTEKFIILPRFKKLVEANNKKYPDKTDPRRIRATAEDLARITMARVSNVDVNNMESGSVLLNQIDRTSTVVGTMNIVGFRGEVYGADNTDPKQRMIGGSINYMDFLKTSPESAEADLARLILEETSTLPAHADIKADSTPDQLVQSKESVYNLLRADLSQKVISTLFTPLSAGLFGADVRTEILRLAANKDQISAGKKEAFTAVSGKALFELQRLVENIRLAEASGEKYYIPANNPDYRFVLNTKTQDGVYAKCTNYSMWVNEGLDLQMRSSKVALGPDLSAGYGIATGTTVTSSSIEYTTINVAAAVSFTVPKAPPAAPPPSKTDNPPAGNGGSGQGAGDTIDKTNPTKTDGRKPITPPIADAGDTINDAGGV